MRESRDQQYTSSQTLERLLNEAIIHADISNSFEEYIEIFDTFYADDIEVSRRDRGTRSWKVTSDVPSLQFPGAASCDGRSRRLVHLHS